MTYALNAKLPASELPTTRPEPYWQLATGPDRMADGPYRRDARHPKLGSTEEIDQHCAAKTPAGWCWRRYA